MTINLPNKLTLLRLFLVPFFMLFMFVDHLWTRLFALLIFILASVTDWYDGRIARQTGTVTVIGTFLDPLVDKMLIAAALIGFVGLPELYVPSWMVVLIISREFLITGLRSVAATRGIVMAAERAGKFKTTSQITAIITTLVILIYRSAAERWPALQLTGASAWHKPWLWLIHWLPYTMMFWVTGLTIVSGYFYLNKYRELLREEFSVLKSKPTT